MYRTADLHLEDDDKPLDVMVLDADKCNKDNDLICIASHSIYGATCVFLTVKQAETLLFNLKAVLDGLAYDNAQQRHHSEVIQ